MKLGLIGKVLGHSLSPAIHEKLFRKLSLPDTYDLIEIPEEGFADRFRQVLDSCDGLNVTIPYKRTVMPFLDEISGEAERIGAVNTVEKRNGRLIGHNTDYTGFARTLDRIGADVKGRDTAVLGHGGASRAIIQCLFDRGARSVTVVSRHPGDVDRDFAAFARDRKCTVTDYASFEKSPSGYLLVNATPVGMFPKTGVSPLSAEKTASFEKVIDIIYNPKETKLLQDASGDRENGMFMLVMQAAAAEEIWQGRKIPADIVGEIAEEMEA